MHVILVKVAREKLPKFTCTATFTRDRYTRVDINNIKILNKNFSNYYIKKKISVALFIKTLKPILNVQVNSIPLQLIDSLVSYHARVYLILLWYIS